MKFAIKDFFRKCDQIRSFLGIWLHVLEKSLMKNFSFCAVCSAVPRLGTPCPLAPNRNQWFLCNQYRYQLSVQYLHPS